MRVTFDPTITTWGRVFTDGGLEDLGAPLDGDSVGGQRIPEIARLQDDLRTSSGVPGFIASLGEASLAVRQERRVTPINAEIGITNRLSLSFLVPIVRTETRASLKLSTAGANLGPNPLATVAGADQTYSTFFSQFSAALTQLSDSVTGGHYGCPASPQCAQAEALLARGQAVRDALERTIYGVGATGSPFIPRVGTDAGTGIDSTVSGIQQQLASGYHVSGFNTTFLLASDSLTEPTFESLLSDSSFGFGYYPLRTTSRYGLGDVELQAKYRVVTGRTYSAAVAGRVRLPTGTRDSTLELFDVTIADHQTALEGRLIQELTLWGRLWLNLSIRAGTERLGTRARRVAPLDAFLVPYQATAVLNRMPGDYMAIDFAPMYKLAPQFSIGLTAGYWTKGSDHYSFQSADDSVALAGRLGVPVAASVLDQGTSQRWLRLGLAVTYVGPAVEGGFTVEQTVSGAGGMVPAATVFRLVFRISRKLF